jgi:demethoxyubiquinone hydroxylase (CLK1/Coq7/Cat5 family)
LKVSLTTIKNPNIEEKKEFNLRRKISVKKRMQELVNQNYNWHTEKLNAYNRRSKKYLESLQDEEAHRKHNALQERQKRNGVLQKAIRRDREQEK